MDLNKLSKAELEQLLGDVVDSTIDELVKSDPSHSMPGLDDDFAESDAVAAANGATTKAEDECEEEDKEKKAKPFEKEDDEEEEKEEKSNKGVADLVKSQLKGMLDINKALASLTDKVERLSKGKARERISAVSEKEVEVIQKAHGASNENDYDQIINATSDNKRAFGKALLDLQMEKKIDGRYLTAYEIYGVSKIPNNLKKSILQKADLLK